MDGSVCGWPILMFHLLSVIDRAASPGEVEAVEGVRGPAFRTFGVGPR